MEFTTFLIIIVLISGFYMAWNIGANDVANAMGTSVGSGALSLKQAIVIAGVLEFCGAFFFGSHVSETVESGIINGSIFSDEPLILVYGMLASLLSAGLWLQLASYFGWPVSTTHSIIGSIVGFGLVVGGIEAIQWDNVTFIAFAWVGSPILGGLLSYFTFTLLLKNIFYVKNPIRATRRITPIIGFIVLFVLSLALLFEGLDNLNMDLTPSQVVVMSLFIGGIGAVISHLSVRRLRGLERESKEHHYDPTLIRNLEKARRNLQRVQSMTTGNVSDKLTSLVDDTEKLSSTLKEAVEISESRKDFYIVEKIFGRLQLMTACLMAFSHGANDVANAIGPLVAAMSILLTGAVNSQLGIPLWALALGGIGIVFGLATWGWRVIETIGRKLTELTPTRGFAAEFSAATTILIASRLGFPISATHTLVGAVLGVGFARGLEALNLATMRDILISWVVTIPAGAGMAIAIYYVISSVF